MTKLTLDNVSSGFNLSVINNNFDKIETEFDKVLYRTNPAETPNSMSQDLDMNGFNINNTDTVSANDVKIGGQSLLDLINNLDIGVIDPLQVALRRFRFIANSPSVSEVSLLFPHNGTAEQILVLKNGILQDSTTYSLSNPTTIVFTTPLALNDLIDVIYFNTLVVTFAQDSEYQLASEGQEFVTLLNFTYTPGSKTLGVYLNGLRKVPTIDYTEETTNSIKFLAPLTLNDEIFVTLGTW